MKQNIHFFIFINIAILALFSDFLGFICNIDYLFRLLIIFIPQLITNILLIKHRKIELHTDFEKKDIVFFMILFFIFLFKVALPDFSYDVANYHIYLQENTNIDKLNFDLMAGKVVNGFLFPLGDKMHYIFRYFLGYRLGTILSYYTLIVMFYQIKNILNLYCKNKKFISYLSIGCIGSTIIYQWLGTYYIDCLGIVFILQLIYELIVQKNVFNSSQTITYVSILCGLSLAIKLSNAFMIIPILLFFLVLRRAEFNLKLIPTYLLCCIIAIIPILPYCIDNYIQTGSPLFPYYNNIFKSEYFGLFSWKDERFKNISLPYALIWPVYTSVIHLGYGDDWMIRDPLWAIGYIIVLGVLIYSLIFRKNKLKIRKEIIQLSILSLLLTAFWIVFLYGYMRYALIIPIMYYIIIAIFFIKLIELKNYLINIILLLFGIITCIAFLLSGSIVISLVILTFIIFFLIKEDSEKYIILFYGLLIFLSLLQLFNICIKDKNSRNNVLSILKDRKEVNIHIDGDWGVIADDSSITELVRENDTPIYNLDIQNYNTSPKALELYYNKIENASIYFLIDSRNYNKKLQKLQENHFKIDKVLNEYTNNELPFLNSTTTLKLVKLKYVN